MSYIITLDQGTSSSRTIIFDLKGNIVSSAQKEITQYYPQPGWVEHDAGEIWRTQCETLHEAVKKSGVSMSEIAAIGITNQRETVVAWDRKTGEPLHRAIVWQDRRTSDMIANIKTEPLENMIRSKTGLPLDPYFSGTKIKWLLDNCPEIRTKSDKKEICFGTVDSWLIYKLTGGKHFCTDASNASRTLLMNIFDGGWDTELCKFVGVSADCLPDILPSNGNFGETDILGTPIPICGVAGDQQAALFGQLCFEPGDVKNTYGTGCFILAFMGSKKIISQNRLLTTIAWQLKGKSFEYALEGSVFVGGAAIQWLRDGLNIIETAPEVNLLAETVKDTEGVYLVPAFTGLGAPYWNPDVRGMMTGISRGSTKAHIARAALESIALQSAEVIQAMAEDIGQPVRFIRVDGGASASNLLMQMQADFSGCEAIRPATLEVTALGASFLAALGKGLYTSQNEMSQAIHPERTFKPNLSESERGKKLAAWKKAVTAAISLTNP